MADRFEKNLREKLGNYERPVTEDIWKGIRHGVDTRRHHGRRIMPIWYAAAGVAAAVCLLVVMYMKNDEQMRQTVAETESRHGIKRGMACDSDIQDVTNIVAMAGTSTRETVTGRGRSVAVMTGGHERTKETAEETVNEKSLTDSGVTASEPKTEDGGNNGGQQGNRNETKNQDKGRYINTDTDRPADMRRKSNGRRGRFSAAIYGTGVPSDNKGGGMPMVMNSTVTNAAASYKNSHLAVTPEPRVEAKHHVPFKFGLGVRYTMTDRLGVEAGVRYTMLKSTFTERPSGTEIHQDAAMIGVPLALTYKIYGNRVFETYGSIGGEVAKTVKADDDLYSELDKPWQMSVNAAIGAQYNITPAIGIYVEPSVGYYFDNGSELRTTYSDHPVNFNVTIGLRFSVR